MPAKAEATTLVHADLEAMSRKSDVRGHTEALLLCKGATRVAICRVGCAGKGLRKSMKRYVLSFGVLFPARLGISGTARSWNARTPVRAST